MFLTLSSYGIVFVFWSKRGLDTCGIICTQWMDIWIIACTDPFLQNCSSLGTLFCRYFSHGICWPYHVFHATKPQLNQAGKKINPQSFLSKANWTKEWYDSGGKPWVSAEKEIVLVFEGGGIHGQGRQRVYTGKAAEHGHWRPSQGRQSVHIGKAVEHKHWSLGDKCSGHAGEEEAV